MPDEVARARELLKKLADLDAETGKKRQEEVALHQRFVKDLEELTELLGALIEATKVYKTKDVGGLSLLAWLIEVGATGCAAIAGAIWGHWSVVASIGCFCLLSIWLCALIVRYRRPKGAC